MRDRRSLLIAVGGLLAVLLLWFLFLWQPQTNRIDDARDRRDAAEDRVEQLELQLARLRASEDRAVELTAQLERLRVAIPEQPNLAQFILDANEAAERSGIDFISVAPSPPSEGDPGDPSVVNLSINITGGYFQVLDFINRLEALPRLVVIDSLTLTPSGAGEVGGVELSAAITARMFTTATPAAPDASGAATTTTTTPAGTTTTTVAGDAAGEASQ